MDSLDTPSLVSPPESKTPPTLKTGKCQTNGGQQSRSTSVDPNALSLALKNFEDVNSHRERTPGPSPSRKRQRVYGDRWGPQLSGIGRNTFLMSVLPGLSRIATDRIYVRALAYSMTMVHPQHPPKTENEHPTASSISRRVSVTSAPNIVVEQVLKFCS